MAEQKNYISITGLRSQGSEHTKRIYLHAMCSMKQAKAAPSNRFAESWTVADVHHTVSALDSDAAMQAYVRAGTHARAMGIGPEIASGKVYGCWSDQIPDREEAHSIWETNGRSIPSEKTTR